MFQTTNQYVISDGNSRFFVASLFFGFEDRRSPIWRNTSWDRSTFQRDV